MKQSTNSKTRVVVYTIFIFLLGVFLAYGIIYKFPAIFQETITKIEEKVTVTDKGIADAVDKVYKSVVVVSTYKNDKLYAQGSGFVYGEKDGKFYIVTNHHVISEGTSFKVTYTDSKEEKAKLLGSDEYADIAVLEVDAKDGIDAVEIGKTDTLRVGDTTFTIGAPLDNVYSWTVTRGIISGKERLVEVEVSGDAGSSEYIMNVLQTDAAVNSGNSGGPLCNSNGEVIGVISAKISSTGVEGMGFAIPIETAQEKTEQIINGKKSEYPYLGVSMKSVSDALSDFRYAYYLRGLDVTSGILVLGVEDNSAASEGGIKVGDIITKIGNEEVSNVAYLRYELYKHNMGDKIKITVLRDGKEKELTVKLIAGGIKG